MSKPRIIGIDFDGTIVKHKYPFIGDPVPLAIETMLQLQEKGHQLVLWTMRSGPPLQQAVEYCESHGIKFWGVNKNPTQKEWTESPKAYCQIYIDDAALGCPLIYDVYDRPWVDWSQVQNHLADQGIL